METKLNVFMHAAAAGEVNIDASELTYYIFKQ